MRRLLWISIAILLFTTAITAAAAKPLAAPVRATLEKALANEREAVVKYEAFAAKAAEEGYAGAASLFRAQVKAEKIHAKRFAQALKDGGAPVPDAAAFTPTVGATVDNLRSAASAEMGERDGMYREAVETCKTAGDAAVRKLFDETRDAEAEHGNLDAAGVRNLDSMKKARTYHVCSRCGYATDVSLPLCPSCRHSGALDEVK